MVRLFFNRLPCRIICFAVLLFTFNITNAQQKDSTNKKKSKFISQMIGMISHDSTGPLKSDEVVRLDKEYLPYSGLIIRNLEISRIPFGTSFEDTSIKKHGTLIKIANSLHKLTKENVISKNLFFQKNDTINPLLFADNRRYLRDLSYIRDAEFKIIPVPNSDSADVIVSTKDIFSLGGSVGSLEPTKTSVEFGEDNIGGSGNALVLYGLYDSRRNKKYALSGEFIRRNIGGSFINQTIGYKNYYTSISAPRQENYFYYQLSKPLLNRFMKFTYEANVSYHSTQNRYNTDSIYLNDYRYRYYQFDGWLGYNINAKSYAVANDPTKLRFLTGLRAITQTFKKVPELYKNTYNWQFADLTAFLGSFSIYRQNFSKAQYVFGFGRPEDISEGMIFSATAGHTIKSSHSRPYINLSFEKYGFNPGNSYTHYTLKAEGYLGRDRPEDINLLGAINYFSPLKNLGHLWMNRVFINLSATKQVNRDLNQPLFINSVYGIPQFGINQNGGNFRATADGESVFFSPWWLAGFKFAPIVFGNVTYFKSLVERMKLYSYVGTGLRIRNESLVFGTIELKGYYFPRKDAHNKSFGGELSLNISFEHSSPFIKKPDFIQVN